LIAATIASAIPYCGGRFDQRVTGLDVAALFGFDNHRQRGTILDRAGGIVALERRESRARVPGKPLQTDERRIADSRRKWDTYEASLAGTATRII
jgi:hypothetical protein